MEIKRQLLEPSNQAGGHKFVALLSQRGALRFITVGSRVLAGLGEVMSGLGHLLSDGQVTFVIRHKIVNVLGGGIE